MVRVLISACLIGERVRYDGGSAAVDDPILRRWHDEGRLVPICPEVEGGLPVPRSAAEIVESRVVTVDGSDVTAPFFEGAWRAVALARENDARIAVLKDGSPSCGTAEIHDGSFSGVTRPGMGITAALLSAFGIAVFSERELPEAEKRLAELES